MPTADDLSPEVYHAIIIGGGPAGLSAALVLGRCRRRVIVFDHGRPRNYAAQGVHNFLGLDGIPPAELRALGRQQAKTYGVEFRDQEVVAVCRIDEDAFARFKAETKNGAVFTARNLLLASGMVDELPRLRNIDSYYGSSVHHCPYCDGWEHRDQRLVALGVSGNAVQLAVALRNWSPHVTVCTSGHPIEDNERNELHNWRIPVRTERAISLEGDGRRLQELQFESGPPLPCDAVFFQASSGQQNRLATMLGCERAEKDFVATRGKQQAQNGLYVAGDASGEVQLAIVAAAEGAVAALAINRDLQKADAPT